MTFMLVFPSDISLHVVLRSFITLARSFCSRFYGFFV